MRRIRLRREYLEYVRARVDRGKCLARRRDTGYACKSGVERARDDPGREVRCHHQAPARVRDASDRCSVEDRTGADQDLVPKARSEAGDAFERLRGVKRHLDTAEARLDDGAGDGFDIVGTYAAQNRDEGQLVEAGVDIGYVNGSSILQVRAMRTKPCAAASAAPTRHLTPARARARA